MLKILFVSSISILFLPFFLPFEVRETIWCSARTWQTADKNQPGTRADYVHAVFNAPIRYFLLYLSRFILALHHMIGQYEDTLFPLLFSLVLCLFSSLSCPSFLNHPHKSPTVVCNLAVISLFPTFPFYDYSVRFSVVSFLSSLSNYDWFDLTLVYLSMSCVYKYIMNNFFRKKTCRFFNHFH